MISYGPNLVASYRRAGRWQKRAFATFLGGLTISIFEFDFRQAQPRRDLSNCSNAIEHRSGLAGIDGFEALGERAVDLGEFIVRFGSSNALRQKPREPYTAS